MSRKFICKKIGKKKTEKWVNRMLERVEDVAERGVMRRGEHRGLG